MDFMPEITNFADYLDSEVIGDSQPISLPSSLSLENEDQIISKNDAPSIRPAKHTGQRGEFRSIEEIDPKYRNVFTYPYFNLVQSRVIEDALYSDKSMVVCAPTGSGKTVVFEMAIVQLLMEMEDKKYTEDFKIIYMAPVKALCTERLTEWYPKFTRLGLFCIEVTGDTNVEFPQLKPYRIIITTPEKWDMLTRRWRDHRGLVEVVKLFLIDEVHILNDDVRGPVLEAVVSRMKTIESSVKSAHRIEQVKKQYENNQENSEITAGPRIRFVAVSATVSNPEDVAQWLGTAEKPAVYYKFGDECRPVKLKRIVEGYSCPVGTSIFKFDIILNYKLWPIIQKYHNGKPTLIFCNTRKSVALTAETLSREITVSFNPEQKAKLTALASTLKNKKLQTLILNGVGCHHAGLLFEERINIEQAFRNRDLPILITTTTLAMGVNLPAHLVIIKNTQQYVNGAYQEYSISTILQMVGRAGRPQYDTEATAVIMTRMADKARYQSLVEGTEPLQSFLHKRLAENLNSEAALQTVTDVAQCVEWVNSTFLSVRAAKDPKRYLGLPPAAPAFQISKKIEELCVKAMNGLASSGLITMDEACCIESTEAGRLMSVYYIDLETMKLIMKIEGSETLERLLWLICESHELSDMHLRVDERRSLNALNRNNNAATIRFPMKGKINSRQMKLNCIIQAVLGCLPIPDPSLNQEAMKIMRIADRVCKCLVAYTTRPTSICQQSKTFSAVLNSIVLAKCIAVHLWENSPFVSKQLKGIGPTFSMLLASAGKVNFMLLEESHPRDLERIMNKGPPAGNVIRKQISLLPKYQLTITPIDRDKARIQLLLLNQSYLSENMDNLTAGDNHKSYIIVGDSENYLLYLNWFKDTDLIRVYDGCITCEVRRKHTFEHKIMVYCIKSNFVGIDVQSEYVFIDATPIYANDTMIIMNKDNTETVSTANFETEQILADRKRKSNIDVDVACSKEKLKRENNLIKKIKCLKESFGKTSKELMSNLNKTTEMSNNLLQKLKQPKSNVNMNTNIETCDKQETMIQPGFVNNFSIIDLTSSDDLFEHLDENNQVNNILNEIENEIGRAITQQDVSNIPEHQSFLISGNENYIPKYKNQKNETKKLHKKHVQCNYNFIDILEKKNDTNEENVDCITCDEGGFANTVKMNIEKYLQNAECTKPRHEDVKIMLETENREEFNIDSDNKFLREEPNYEFDTTSSNVICKDISDHLNISTLEEERPMLTKEKNTQLNNYVLKSDERNTNITINPNEDNTHSNITPPLTSCVIKNENVISSNDIHLNKNKDLVNRNINIKKVKKASDESIRYTLEEENQNLDEGNNDCRNNNTKQLQSINDFALIPSCSSESTPIIEENFSICEGSDIKISTIDSLRENKADIHVCNNEFSNPKCNSTYNVSNDNTFDVNLNDRNRTEKYSYRATKFDVCNNVGTTHTVKVIRKLKIDLDITTIISPISESPMSNEVVIDLEQSKVNEDDSNMTMDFRPFTTLENRIRLEGVEEALNKKSTALQNSNILESRHNQSKTEKCSMEADFLVPETDGNEKVYRKDNNSPENINIVGNSNLYKDFQPQSSVRYREENEIKNDSKVLDIKSPLKHNHPKTEKCNNVEEILKKYSAIMKRNKLEVPVIKQINKDTVIETPKDKPKRRYKISDIPNLEFPLLKMSIVDNYKQCDINKQITEKGQNKVSRGDNLNHDSRSSDISECQLPTTQNTELLDELNAEFESNTDIICPLSNELFQIEHKDSTSNINNVLLDPRTLIQRSNNDDSCELIPPPPEFADVSINSPRENVTSAYTPSSPEYPPEAYCYYANKNSICDTSMKQFDNESDAINFLDRFSQDTEFTPKEIETWTLSCEDNVEDYNISFRNPNENYTVRRNNFSNINSRYSNSRHAKLGEFKFKRKKHFPLKNNLSLN